MFDCCRYQIVTFGGRNTDPSVVGSPLEVGAGHLWRLIPEGRLNLLICILGCCCCGEGISGLSGVFGVFDGIARDSGTSI